MKYLGLGEAPTAEELRAAIRIVALAGHAAEGGRKYREECGRRLDRLLVHAATLATEGLPKRRRRVAAHRAVTAVREAHRLYGEDRA